MGYLLQCWLGLVQRGPCRFWRVVLDETINYLSNASAILGENEVKRQKTEKH